MQQQSSSQSFQKQVMQSSSATSSSQQFSSSEQMSSSQQQFSSSQSFSSSRSEQVVQTRQVTQQRVQQVQQVQQQQQIGYIQQQVSQPIIMPPVTPVATAPSTPGGVQITSVPPTPISELQPPVFEQIFKNSRFAQGGNALFEGRLKGNPKPEVSWTRKGAPLLDCPKYRLSYNQATGSVSLMINQIGPGDEGEYTCKARNTVGEAICSVFIQPEGMPQQQQQRVVKEQVQQMKTVQQHQYTNGVNGYSYESEEFKVDTFEYRLLREVSYRETLTRRYAGEADATLSTVIDRALGPAAPPQISQKPRNSKLVEGSDATFTTKVAANPKPRLTWFKDGQRIIQSADKYETIYSNQQATLRIKKATSKDSGHYTLLAENIQGCVVSSAVLAIEPAHEQPTIERPVEIIDVEATKSLVPQFVKVFQDRETTEGKMTRFDCRVTGRPYPEVSWYINGNLVINDNTHKILVNEQSNHSLMITNVHRTDAGVITCVARNKSAEIAHEARLVVLEKEQVVAPKFVERFTTVNVKEGEPVRLHARAVGTPIPRITWQKDGIALQPSAEVIINIDNGATTVDIPCAKATDAAWYQCSAQNVAGSTATRARLFVETQKGQMQEQKRLQLPRPTKVIEPPPAPEPEIIYLRHVERAKPHVAAGEADRIYPAPKFITPLKDAIQYEGGKVHFECRIEPVDDPTMRVEWFLNGNVVTASSRSTCTFQFGFIALDLLSIIMQDSGEYVCRVTSSTGVAESRAMLSVQPRPSIEQTTQHQSTLEHIQSLEEYKKYQRTESLEEVVALKPVFTRPLEDLGDLDEGRNAHFEAQITPVSDPTMRIEWYKDGRPITASSRITAIFNFGYVSLNIMHLRAEDAGQYTVRAVNRLGEAISTSNIVVNSRTTVTGDLGIPEQQMYIQKVEELEQYQKYQNQKFVEETPECVAPPEFKTPISDQVDIREGGFAHFEARLEPVGDSTMQVEWFKDGQPVEASSRITAFNNFGYVALTIKQVTALDVGTYTCRAKNAMGETQTSAKMTVITKTDVVAETQQTEIAQQKIQYLEDHAQIKLHKTTHQEELIIDSDPRFLGPLKGTTKILEGQRAHFEARIEPQSDTTMVIEWYHNGNPLRPATRIHTYHDFGYVALDILDVRAEDAGNYTCVARNSLGQTQIQATMIVETRSSIDTTSMHHVMERQKIVQQVVHEEPQYQVEELCKTKPIFVTPLSDPQPVGEGRNIHLECKLEPMGDPTMQVEWFQNGKPITIGSRFRTYYDFGFVALDILHVSALDCGEYTVRATNRLGSSHTSACVRVISHSDICTETQNEMSLEQIQYLEDASRMRRDVNEEIIIQQAPAFVRPLHNIETMEGTNVHLECRLHPVGDPTMRVDWFVNGHPVKIGHRFRPAHEFDYVALDLLGVYATDSGVYTCQARNALGEAVTSCSVRIIAKKDLILESQYPQGLEKLQFLEDIAKYKRTEDVDEVVNVKPRFLTKPKNIDHTIEGGHAHFECKLEPVTDPNLKVEWYKNGRPITIGHRFRPIHDFGYVALDITDLISEDTGTYTCRAVNLVGADEVNMNLVCRSTQQILTTTQNELGMEQIHMLEDKSRYSRSEYIEERTTQAPMFTTSLKNIEIKEGQRAHFECRLIPVSDATLRVEWYHNNQPVKQGSRFTETNSFGFVALDILGCLAEDSGTYTCRAINALGEAVTSATCMVHTRKSIYVESHHESALSSLRHLEDSSRFQREQATDDLVTQAPVFTLPIRDVKAAENQAIHFEARLIPVGDPNLKVEWLRNGIPIEASNRVMTMHDFGYVALNMKYVNPEDSGTYTCRATNELGQAVTSATLMVQSKASLDLEAINESAIEKIRLLEDISRFARREEEDYVVNSAPRFTTKLHGPTQLVEQQSAHYECRIEPYPDPTMKVEWYHNGQPLTTGHRFRTTCDFGFAALDILTVYAEDAGEYTCKATNRLGTADSSIKLSVSTKEGIERDTQHEGALEKIHYLECDRNLRRGEVETVMAEKPTFGRPLKPVSVAEGRSVHLEATLTPVNDPTMNVEWYCNGRPIQQGHRFKTTYDFGFVALDILYAHSEDTGTYMCKAKNAVGEAVTTCAVKVTANAGLCLDTLDEQRLQKIRELESYEKPKTEEVEPTKQKPVFLTPLTSLENLKEGDYAHLECRVEPINDPDLKIEWFINGKAIRAGHRFRTTHDFGYVALDILYVYGEDTGVYMCKATNKVGEAVSTCNIRCVNKRSIIFESQHPDGLEKIQKLEAHVRPARTEIEDAEVTVPRFVTELRGTTEIAEGQTAHFEAQVEPIHDPNLRIEFYHNGKALQSASRFHITFDFGYVALDIQHCVAADAGEYSVKAINAKGQCQSSIKMVVTEKGSIIYDSQHPEGLDKIKQLEGHAPFKRPEVDDAVTRQRPVFTQPLQNIDYIAEGDTAHFECRLIPVGDPNLKVEWYRNEKPLEDSSRISKQHDFGYVSMDLKQVREEDEGVYMCRAINPLGEAVTTASMKIKTKASIQLETQHPEGMKKIMRLEQPHMRTQEDQDQVFEKPIFTQLLTGPTELWEGNHAHFEARVVPVGDSSMKYEWYVNGVELKMGSRFRTTHDFGFVTLDINSVVSDDSGVYMCKAINKAGEAVSSTSMKIKTKGSIQGEPLLPEAWQKIQLKEAAMNRVPDMFIDTTPQQAPVFTTHLESHEKLTEGQHVYLEAQVEPRADPNLRIEWFKNGVPLTTGSRIRSTFDFGLVTLSINGLRADDSAIYTCKATNDLGVAVSTATLKIDDRHWLLGDTLHPSSLKKISDLEAPRVDYKDIAEPMYESPVFIGHLNNVECKEGENVHFEATVEPSKDPTMQIEWFVNGRELPTGSRFKTTYDFGYVSLDITGAYAEDSGIYTCKATNNKGTASSSGTLKCSSTTTMYLDTQHPQGKVGLEAVEGTDRAVADKYKRQLSGPEKDYPAPTWIVKLQEEYHLSENETLHLEGTVEPKEDPNLKIEWYFNGKLLQHGSRFKMTNDFGFVTLDLTDVYERDQGIYTCKAYNKKGEAFTTSTVFCSSKESLIWRTQHPKGAEGLEKIQDLEDKMHRPEGAPSDAEAGQAPRFTSEFVELKNVGEGEIAHFDATLVPTGDQTMNIEWFYNGKVLEASHRVRTVYAFGMVVLEILGTKIEDSGKYTCRATNKWGTAEISVNLECNDKSAGQKPRFTTQLQNLEGLKDGQSAHFECTLVPVNDPDLKVEWYHNGKPLRHSNRHKLVSDFGYVLFDIGYVQSHDSGEYVCRAWNKYGEDTTKATLKCFGKSGVYLDSLQPDSLARIRELESAGGMRPRTPGTPVGEAPKFTTEIQDLTKLVEGQSAHFEARLTPITDPDLVVEWFWNGEKLPHGHRYRTFHDFGIVILDILYCYEENSGVFECRATNKYGTATTKATLKCVSKADLILDSQLPRGMEGGLEKIQTLEDSLIRYRDERSTAESGRAPVFTVPLSNIDSLREGESAHFEARLTPTDDPKLKVEWFWNGKPLKAGSRFRTFCDFGFVILEISPVYPEDSGEYSCRATNEYGEAVTISTMKVQGKRSIILESQLPKGMEGTIGRIAELEGLGMAPQGMPLDDDTGKAPEFITTPNDMTLTENSLAHFECRLIPINDPSMRVEWYHNGKALWAGSRIKTINDFGFVILEIAGCYQRDSGLYTCKATNSHGEATVSCKLQVKGRQGIIMEPQLPSNFRSGVETIQKLEENMHKREEMYAGEEEGFPPKFIVEIKDNIDISEGGPVHFDCRVTPVGDSSLRIDWYHNGKPFATGSRVHMLNDFGFIAMDMDYAYVRDSGVYECRATNKWGTASTFAKVTVVSRGGIILDSQLPEGMTASKLKELERGPMTLRTQEDRTFGPPKFVTHIQSASMEEGENLRFECRVEPKEDPKLKIEWIRNGKPLPSGHRYRTIYDMGFISLDILSVYIEDAGEYICRATNEHGKDETKATIKCKILPSIVLQNQIPKGMQKSETLMQMEATIKKYTKEIHLTEDDLYDPDRRQPPRFVVQITDQTKLVEMQSTKFECQLAPVGDPNMKVEWFFNGKPLPFKNRFTPIYDFGYVAMNFAWIYPEDSGEYVCRATNLYGMDETRANIKTTGKPGIIYDSQLPKGMKSIQKIREMESMWTASVPEQPDDSMKPKKAPVFVMRPESVEVEEGEWARFNCRVTGHPKPRVMWLINGHTVVNGQRYKLTYDGMYHFDVPRTRQYDTGKIEVIARSSAGEAMATCQLNITPRKDDYRGVLKNSPRQIEGTKSYRKPEWVTYMEEMKEALAVARVVPSFIYEVRDCRAMIGERAVFNCEFKGNPKPDILWYFKGKLIITSKRFRVLTTQYESTLTIYPIEAEDFGFYLCKAMNEAGVCESSAKLDESFSATMNDETRAEMDAKFSGKTTVQKKVTEQKRSRTSTQFKSTKDHDITEISAQFKTQEKRQIQQETITTTTQEIVKEFVEEKMVLTQKPMFQIKSQEEVIIQEIQPDHSIREIEHKVLEQKADVVDIKTVRQSVQVNEMLKNMRAAEFGPGEAPLRDLATIAYLVKHGISVNEINSFYQASQFPALQTPDAQSALVLLLEREGHANIVTEVLTEETGVDDTFVASYAGFTAFMRMVEMHHASVEEIITHFLPEDFVGHKWKTETAHEKFEQSHLVSSKEVHKTETTTMQKKEMQIKGATTFEIEEPKETVEHVVPLPSGEKVKPIDVQAIPQETAKVTRKPKAVKLERPAQSEDLDEPKEFVIETFEPLPRGEEVKAIDVEEIREGSVTIIKKPKTAKLEKPGKVIDMDEFELTQEFIASRAVGEEVKPKDIEEHLEKAKITKKPKTAKLEKPTDLEVEVPKETADEAFESLPSPKAAKSEDVEEHRETVTIGKKPKTAKLEKPGKIIDVDDLKETTTEILPSKPVGEEIRPKDVEEYREQVKIGKKPKTAKLEKPTDLEVDIPKEVTAEVSPLPSPKSAREQKIEELKEKVTITKKPKTAKLEKPTDVEEEEPTEVAQDIISKLPQKVEAKTRDIEDEFDTARVGKKPKTTKLERPGKVTDVEDLKETAQDFTETRPYAEEAKSKDVEKQFDTAIVGKRPKTAKLEKPARPQDLEMPQEDVTHVAPLLSPKEAKSTSIDELKKEPVKVTEKPKVEEPKKKVVKKVVKKSEEDDILERLLNLEVEKVELETVDRSLFEVDKKEKVKLEKGELIKLEPIKIERKEQKPTKVQIVDTQELAQTVQLKKVTIPEKKEIEEVKIPKKLLKSRIETVEYPPEPQTLKITQLDTRKGQGILSRNIEEVEEIQKTKLKKFKHIKKDKPELEELDIEHYEKEPSPEQIAEEKPKYERQVKEKPEETVEDKTLKLGKGKIKQEEFEPEEVKLKKRPQKEEIPQVEEKVIPKKAQEKPVEPEAKKVIKKIEKPVLGEFEIDEPEYEHEELEKPEPAPKSPKLKEEEKPKYERKPKEPKEEEIIERPIIPGIPKKPEPEPEEDISLKYKQKPKTEEEPEPIKLKPFTKEKPETKDKPKETKPKEAAPIQEMYKLKKKLVKEEIVEVKFEPKPAEKPKKVVVKKPKKPSIDDDEVLQRLLNLEVTKTELETAEQFEFDQRKRDKQSVELEKPQRGVMKEQSPKEKPDDVVLKMGKGKIPVQEDFDEKVSLKKPPIKPQTTEEGVEASFKIAPEKPKPTREDIEAEFSLRRQDSSEAEEMSEEVVIKRKSKSKKAAPVVEELEEEVVSIKKKKPRRPSPTEYPAYTDVENVTFRPKSTTTKEDVEQEFKIQLDSYAEEEISMSGKVKLKKAKPYTFAEEADEASISIIKEPDHSGPIIEEVLDDISEAEDTMYDVEAPEEFSHIEELPEDLPEHIEMKLKRRRDKKKREYKIEDLDEESISISIDKREKAVTYEEESLSMKKPKRKPVPTYTEAEASLSITRDAQDVENQMAYSITAYEAENDKALNLVEGERVYIIERTSNSDWWFVKKTITEEKGWVPADVLMDNATYTHYVQKTLYEKMDKLPVFEKPGPNEKSMAPRFIEKLEPVHVQEGYTVQFECKVEGFPRPQITWFRQTQVIKPSEDFQIYYDDDNVATLIIRDVFPEDGGSYTCVAKNTAGIASSTAELIVEVNVSDRGSDVFSRKSMSRESSLADILEGIPPTFSRKPKAQCVNEGSNVLVECRLVAVPEPDIFWYYNGKEIQKTENIEVVVESDMHMYCSVIRIKNIKKKQEGTYEVVARNREGEAKLPISIKVQTGEKEPPQVLEPLKNLSIRKGETCLLTTQIVGNPKPKVQWFMNGKPIKEPIVEDKDTYTLTIMSPSQKNAGEYTVKATNPSGTVETSAYLTVDEYSSGNPQAPLFIERFEELNVPQNGTIRLPARVSGNPIPEIEWLLNNKKLKESPKVKPSYDGENIELIIFNADSELDSGMYKCIAFNPIGTASHGARVTVDVDKISFTRNLRKLVTVEESKTVTLECETSHTTTTTWYHNNKELSGMDHRVLVEEGRIHKLVIKNITVNDSGTYSCTVKDQSTECNINVYEAKPEFLKKLQDFDATEGETAVMEVEITSEAADVTWYKDGEVLTSKKSKLEFIKRGKTRKLYIRNVSIHDEGEYTCLLADHECTAEVNVTELPPEILTKMEDLTIACGEKATFEIELSKGDALVDWFKDGKELKFSDHVQLNIDGKRQKLKIYDSTEKDSGEYKCVIGNQVSKANLTVEKPMVEFVKRLPDITLSTKESDAVFSVELSKPVEVLWYKNGIEISANQKYTIVSEKTVKKLIVKSTKDDDAAEYTCVAYNVKTSSKLKVEVIKMPPTILEDKKEYKVKNEDDVTISIKFKATPKPEAEWYVNKKLVVPSKHFVPTVGEESASLTIKKAVDADAGEYTVKLRNQCGDAEASLNVVIMKPPSAPKAPEPVDVADDSLTLYWKQPEDNGNCTIIEYIVEYQEKTQTTWTKITSKETTTKITKLKKNSEYVFKVSAVNEVGCGPASPNSSYIKVVAPSKKQAPVINEPLKDVHIGLKQSVTLSCVIGGKPEPQVQWFKNGKSIKTKTMTYDNKIAKYVIESTTEETSGKYTCKAANEMGSVETSCTIYIEEKPSISVDEKFVIQSQRVSSEYNVTATFKGYPAPEITWYKDGTVIKTTKERVIQTTTTTTSITIKDLIRTDGGKYMIEAKNSAGSTTIELNLKVIDKPSKPEGPIKVRENTPETVLLEWRPPKDDGGLEISKYSIEKCDPQQKSWIKVADVTSDIWSYCIQKVADSAQYMFRIIASNPVGQSEALESDLVTITKTYEVPSPPRGPIETTGMTNTSFTLKWRPSEKNGGTKIIEYIVEIRETSKKVWKMIGSTNGNDTLLEIENLIKKKAYDFRITARNKAGTSQPLVTEESIVVGKKITPPSAPQNVRIYDVTSKSITLEWEQPERNGGADITGYIIEKRLSTSSQWTKIKTLDAYCLSFCIDNLKEKSELVFRVFAENAMGLSPSAESEFVVLRTHATVPSPPTGPLEIRYMREPNQNIIEWGIPLSDGGAPLEGYNIAIRDIKKTMWIEVGRVQANTQRFVIRDLQEGHEYLVRVMARNEIGVSEPLESEDPYKVLHGTTGHDYDDHHEDSRTDFTEPTKSENTSSWLRDNNMDADINSYARGKLLKKDEYFFRIWHYAKQLFK